MLVRRFVVANIYELFHVDVNAKVDGYLTLFHLLKHLGVLVLVRLLAFLYVFGRSLLEHEPGPQVFEGPNVVVGDEVLAPRINALLLSQFLLLFSQNVGLVAFLD